MHTHTHTHTHTHIHSLSLSLSRASLPSLVVARATHTQSALQGSRTFSCPRTRMTWRTIHVRVELAWALSRTYMRAYVRAFTPSPSFPPRQRSCTLHHCTVDRGANGLSPRGIAASARLASPRSLARSLAHSDSSRDPGESRKDPRDSFY